MDPLENSSNPRPNNDVSPPATSPQPLSNAQQPGTPQMPRLVPFGPGVARQSGPQPSEPVQGYYTSKSSNTQTPHANAISGQPSNQSPAGPPQGSSLNNTVPSVNHGYIPEPSQTYPGDPGQQLSPGNYAYKPPRSARKLLLLILLPLLLLIGGAAAYYFVVYVPNKPENVFSAGLERTGMAFDTLTAAATDKKQVDKFKSSELSGSAVVSGPDGRQSGTFSSKYDAENSTSELTYSPDDKGKDLNLQVLSDLADGAEYPDLFFKVTGMSVLQLNEMYPGLEQYEGRWVNAAPEFWDSMIPKDSAEDNTDKTAEFSEEDFNALLKISVDTTREYVFTDDPAKTVLVRKAIKGAETLEGQPSYRYTVGINKNNLAEYCKALSRRILDAPAYKRIPLAPQDDLVQLKKDANAECDKTAKEVKDTDTFDMWVSRKTKLVSQIRVEDPKNKGEYADVGQSYTGGNAIPMYVVVNSEKNNYHIKATLDIDFQKSTTKSTVAAEFKSGADKDDWKINVTLSSKPLEGDVTVTKPKDAVPVKAFMDAIGLGDIPANGTAVDAPAGSPMSGVQSKAKDTERQTDLKALQGQLEAYYAQKGYYPNLADVNNSLWRQTNMKGLDTQALADPDGKRTELAKGKSTAVMYGFELQDCAVGGVPDCQGYVLTAMLSSGSLFTVSSLN